MSSGRTSFGRGQTNTILYYENGGHIKSTEIKMTTQEYISKKEALSLFGADIVEKARDTYETDFGKTFFSEDADETTECVLSSQEQMDYLYKVRSLLGPITQEDS